MDRLQPLSTQPSSASLANVSTPSDNDRKKVLLTGLRRSGKTSIQKFVFGGMTAKETFWLEPSSKVTKLNVDSLLPIQIWDVPPNYQINQLDVPLSQFSAMIFVLDFQDHWQQATARLIELSILAFSENRDIVLEVFVHKSDTSSDDYKLEDFRTVQQRVLEGLVEYSEEYADLPIIFRLTSIYDHSIYDAFSQAFQRLDEHLATWENLLNSLRQNSQFIKAFLFDTVAKVHVATDSTPHNSAIHNLCCDFLQLLTDFSKPYQAVRPDNGSGIWSCSLRLVPDSTLVYWQITKHIALVAVVPTSAFETSRGLIEYNVVFFREGVQEILGVIEADRKQYLNGR